jgi:hypothetical protein
MVAPREGKSKQGLECPPGSSPNFSARGSLKHTRARRNCVLLLDRLLDDRSAASRRSEIGPQRTVAIASHVWPVPAKPST